jgi:hypothetical protein
VVSAVELHLVSPFLTGRQWVFRSVGSGFRILADIGAVLYCFIVLFRKHVAVGLI